MVAVCPLFFADPQRENPNPECRNPTGCDGATARREEFPKFESRNHSYLVGCLQGIVIVDWDQDRMQLYDSSDRKPAEYVMFALAFIGFGIGLGGVILSLP